MGNLQVKTGAKKYDVIIVGSGAGGGMSAYILANAGLKVCLLEAGPMFDPAKNGSMTRSVVVLIIYYLVFGCKFKL